MSDTHPVAAEIMRQRVKRLTPAERLTMGCDMFDTARALVEAGQATQGAIDPRQHRIRVFLRTYGDAFDRDERDRIVTRLSAASDAVR
jgi:hypothetical protein